MVWMMWQAVIFNFHRSVHYGMCSIVSCSAEYVHRSWQGFL